MTADEEIIANLARIVEQLQATRVSDAETYDLTNAQRDINAIAREQTRIANMLKRIQEANNQIADSIASLKSLIKEDDKC